MRINLTHILFSFFAIFYYMAPEAFPAGTESEAFKKCQAEIESLEKTKVIQIDFWRQRMNVEIYYPAFRGSLPCDSFVDYSFSICRSLKSMTPLEAGQCLQKLRIAYLQKMHDIDATESSVANPQAQKSSLTVNDDKRGHKRIQIDDQSHSTHNAVKK